MGPDHQLISSSFTVSDSFFQLSARFCLPPFPHLCHASSCKSESPWYVPVGSMPCSSAMTCDNCDHCGTRLLGNHEITSSSLQINAVASTHTDSWYSPCSLHISRLGHARNTFGELNHTCRVHAMSLKQSSHVVWCCMKNSLPTGTYAVYPHYIHMNQTIMRKYNLYKTYMCVWVCTVYVHRQCVYHV